MDNINNGLKFAGQMLGIRTASDVADLVSKAFSSTSGLKMTSQKVESPPVQIVNNEKASTNTIFNPSGFISGVLNLMGFDPKKLGALAINGIIFIAQLIGNTLMGGGRRPQPIFEANNKQSELENDTDNEINEGDNSRKGRVNKNGSPLDWIIQNSSEELQLLLKEMQNKKLPEYLAEVIDKLEQEKGSGDCIKQLLCKSALFIWGMQKSVAERLNNNDFESDEQNNNNNNRLNVFFKYLPDVETYKKHSHSCGEKYSKCNTVELDSNSN